MEDSSADNHALKRGMICDGTTGKPWRTRFRQPQAD
jgi:hypothetical protein